LTQELKIYNSITRKKEVFTPLNAPYVGMYVCGPTVYGDPHLGHARPAIIFDVVFRYLQHLDYKVRYVRNITDVGHLEDEVAGEGESKIEKKAKLQRLEPMEIIKYYTDRYHQACASLNTLPPSIEPTASGHIIEQIAWVQKILDSGFAYEVDGSVYFDVQKYNDAHDYGKLSGRVLEDLLETTRELAGQDIKRNKADFAIWKKADPIHIMQWPSPWGQGFPGWHLECSVLSTKYLGQTFDLHGGGMDLLFPHHECEIAQSVAHCGHESVRYWMHNNMITVNGQKMGKSLGNFITLEDLFEGNGELLEQAYSPMTIRFFILQAHYRSTVDFSNEALKAAEKGYKRLMNAKGLLANLVHTGNKKPKNAAEDARIQAVCAQCYTHINDDFNTAQVLADLFELSGKINAFYNKQLPLNSISASTFDLLTTTFNTFITNILGLADVTSANDNNGLVDGLMDLLLQIRANAREQRDWATSDKIRNSLKALNVTVKDGKDGTNWTIA